MNKQISKIPNNVQDKSSEAWKKLCEYVDYVAENKIDEFSPREYLGNEFFLEIYTLPESIKKLKNVKKIWLYGSNLKRIPPEIGEMESLEYFDPYTSYSLHWFPYEITKCKNLKDSRISTRALYGNYKNRMPFPRLDHNPVKYESENIKCSICNNEMPQTMTNQLWITLRVGTDTIPMLVNSCSEKCEATLPQPQKGYVPYAHKGGADLKQPSYEEWEEFNVVKMTLKELNELNENSKKEEPKLLKLVRKIWEK